MPRWLVVLGLVAGLTLLVALLRYAIDLLGVVFVIILVGFAIRALSDWLTEGESVSGWAMSALSMGLMGTVLVGLWLFNSRDLATDTIQRQLPGPFQRTVAWLETQGWGQRVLLSGGSGAVGVAVGGGGGAAATGTPAAEAPDEREPVAMARPPRVLPSMPDGAVTRPRSSPARRDAGSAGEVEAAPVATAPAPEATAPPVEARAPAIATTVTLSAAPTRAVVGRSVRLTASVRAAGGEAPPGGVVVFSSGGAVIGRATVRNGTAVLTTLGLAIGDHTLWAEYSGDDTHLPSRSAAITQTVARN